MFPGLYNQPNYVLSQIKKKCFDEKGNITRKSAKTLGVHQLVFSRVGKSMAISLFLALPEIRAVDAMPCL